MNLHNVQREQLHLMTLNYVERYVKVSTEYTRTVEVYFVF